MAKFLKDKYFLRAAVVFFLLVIITITLITLGKSKSLSPNAFAATDPPVCLTRSGVTEEDAKQTNPNLASEIQAIKDNVNISIVWQMFEDPTSNPNAEADWFAFFSAAKQKNAKVLFADIDADRYTAECDVTGNTCTLATQVSRFLNWITRPDISSQFGQNLYAALLINEPYEDNITTIGLQSLYSQAKAIAPNIPLAVQFSKEIYNFRNNQSKQFADGQCDFCIISALEYKDGVYNKQLLEAHQEYSRKTIIERDPDAIILSSVQVFGSSDDHYVLPTRAVIDDMMSIILSTDPDPDTPGTVDPIDGLMWQSWQSNTRNKAAIQTTLIDLVAITDPSDPLFDYKHLINKTRETCSDVAPSPSSSSTPSPSTRPGDLDGDGNVNMTDILYLLVRYILGSSSNADINSDGKVNLFDFGKLVILIGQPEPTSAPSPAPSPGTFQGCTPNEVTACTSLGSSFSGGNATCRTDGSGYDISNCSRTPLAGRVEMVKPAERSVNLFATARCNDGSPFGYDIMIAPQNSPRKNDWVIALQGGGLCDDYAKLCSERVGRLTSTPPQTNGQLYSSAEFGGILNPTQSQNPTWYDANRVYAYYCSSDVWLGDTTVRQPTRTAGDWYFSGDAIIRGLFNSLKLYYGLDSANSQTRILYTGTSAGGCGVFGSAHILKNELLPGLSDTGNVKLVIDGCWAPQWENLDYPLDLATTVDLDVYNKMLDFYPATIDPACEAIYPNERGKCFMLKNLYPYIHAAQYLNFPVLIQNSSRDRSMAVDNHGIPADPNHPVMIDWKNLILEEFDLAQLEWVFSSDDIYHTIITKDTTGFDPGWCRVESSTGQRFCDMVTGFWNDNYTGNKRAITR